MADQYGLTPEDYLDDAKGLSNARYSQVIVATLMLYDFIYHIPQQVQYLHRREWSKLHVIYFSILIMNWAGIIMWSYTTNKAWASKSWCLSSIAGIDFFITFTSLVMKILLVLRLRAIWSKDLIVTLILYFMTAAEVLSAMSVMIFDIYLDSVSALLSPLHGCWMNTAYLDNIDNHVDGAFHIIRMVATAIEVILTFIRFTMTYKTQMAFGDGIRARISHMRTSTRLLYVFYRDGTLLFIPLLVFSFLEAISWLLPVNLPVVSIAFLDYFPYFIYPFIVSRLILNLLEANCPLDESIDSRTMEPLRFRHSESDRDNETDISRGDRGATSLGEEIHEETR